MSDEKADPFEAEAQKLARMKRIKETLGMFSQEDKDLVREAAAALEGELDSNDPGNADMLEAFRQLDAERTGPAG